MCCTHEHFRELFVVFTHCIHTVENEERLEEQLHDVSSVRVGLKDKTVKVSELEVS